MIFVAAEILKLLVVEPEYFIALDVHRVVIEQAGGEAVIEPSSRWTAALDEHSFNLVVTRLERNPEIVARKLSAVRARGAGIVFTSTYVPGSTEMAATGRWPVVQIPFTDEDLLSALGEAQARMHHEKRPSPA